MIYEKALKERDRLDVKIAEIKTQLENLPEGKLVEKLAIRKYLLSQVKEMEHEKRR